MKSYTMDLGGRPLTLEFGEVCKQANGGLLVRYGDTVVVVAATGTKTPREGVDFFPLTVPSVRFPAVSLSAKAVRARTPF